MREEWQQDSPYVVRPELEGLVAERLEQEGIVCLCAGSGLGKTMLAHTIAESERQRSSYVCEVSLAAMNKRDALREAKRAVARCLRALGKHEVLLVLDDIPSFDEDLCAELVASLQKLHEQGARVVLCMRPDAEQLALELGVAPVHAYQMLVPRNDYELWGLQDRFDKQRNFELTHGIAALVAARNKDERAGLETTQARGSYYFAAVEQLFRELFEGQLMHEELELRAAILLLGHGNIAELSSVVSRSDPDLIHMLQRDEPALGLDYLNGSFSVVGSSEADPTLEVSVCASLGAWTEDLAEKVIELLVRRGEFYRAGVIARELLGPDKQEHFVCEWVVELINVGLLTFVQDVLWAAGRKKNMAKFECAEELERARRIVSYLVCPASEIVGLQDEDRALPSVEERSNTKRLREELIYAARMIDVSCFDTGVDLKSCFDSADEIVVGLASHIAARRLLLQGDATQAFRLLLIHGSMRSQESLLGALLTRDFETARCLVGDAPNPTDARRARQASNFLATHGYNSALAYSGYESRMLARAFGAAGSMQEAELLKFPAPERGDRTMQVQQLFGELLEDVWAQRLTRAHVRAAHVVDIARQARCNKVADAANLIDAFVVAEQDEPAGLERIARNTMSDFERTLAHIGLAACEAQDLPSIDLERIGEISISAGQALILELACHAFGELSRNLRELIPPSWKHTLMQLERTRRAWFEQKHKVVDESIVVDLGGSGDPVHHTSGRKESAPEGGSRARSTKPARLKLLGGFSLWVGEERVRESVWRRKAAKHILALVAAAKEHVVSKAKVLEIVWPGKDYDRGRSSVYTATSAIKDVFELYGAISPVISSSDGELRLDLSLIYCDIDEFEDLCVEALSGLENDERTVECCREIEKLYRGDLYVPRADSSGMLLRRRAELKRKCADAMVAGSEAALRIGRCREAVWFAKSAQQHNALREDAALALVRALHISGRTIEARSEYELFARNVADVTGRPPSRRIRALAVEIFEGKDPKRAENSQVASIDLGKALTVSTQDEYARD